MATTEHHGDGRKLLHAHAQRIVGDYEMRVAKDNLTRSEFQAIEQLIQRIDDARGVIASGGTPYKDYSEERLTKTIRRMIGRAQLRADIKALQEDRNGVDSALAALLKG